MNNSGIYLARVRLRVAGRLAEVRVAGRLTEVRAAGRLAEVRVVGRLAVRVVGRLAGPRERPRVGFLLAGRFLAPVFFPELRPSILPMGSTTYSSAAVTALRAAEVTLSPTFERVPCLRLAAML